jgi:hypothetical protein
MENVVMPGWAFVLYVWAGIAIGVWIGYRERGRR